MSIIRVWKEEGFTTVANAPFENKDLSWESRGLLAYLLTKPNGWTVRVTDLINNGPAGRDKVRKMLKELQRAGHLMRSRIRDEKTGRFVWRSEVYELPIDLPIDVFSVDGKPVDIVNTELDVDNNNNNSGKLTHQTNIQALAMIVKIDLGGNGDDARKARSLYFEHYPDKSLQEIAELAIAR